MDSDQGKLFIGGISWETSEDKLKEYFGNYGEILQTVVMRDKISGRPRGFGFVVFADPSVLDTVLQEKHTIDGRTVEAKRALSREEQQVSKAGNANAGRSFGGGGGNMRTKKIFVGGLPPTLSEDGFRQYFEAYGQVTDVVVMYDQQTNRPRGFGFISFDSEDAVDRVLHKTFHDLNGKQVEVKRALPKDANPGGGGGGRSMGGGASGGGGNYQGYGASGGNSGSYESRMDSNRYIQSQNAGGGFPPYGSSGYGTPGYGYGPGSNGMGYNGYGSYGGGNPGYGGPAGAPTMALAPPILMSQPQFQPLFSTKTNTQVTPSPVSIVIRNRIQSLRWVVPQSRRCTTTFKAMAGGGLYSAQQFELTPQNVDTVLDDVRPYLIADGGNVDVVSVQDGIVSLKLQGACGSCPSSTTTMKMGIERVLKEKFGDAVKDIVQVYDEQPAETTVEAVNGHLEILRPAIANFGGSVEVLSVEGGECLVKYTGPESIGSGVKAAIKEKFPDIVNVVFTG